MAVLTSDLVWLVEQTITLADGSTTRALVPQVYVRVQDGDLQSSGALIAGDSINLNLSGDLTNSGTIAGRKVVALTAENIQNLGGRIQGNDVGVRARTDLNIIGGSISADNSLSASAGRDMKVKWGQGKIKSASSIKKIAMVPNHLPINIFSSSVFLITNLSNLPATATNTQTADRQPGQPGQPHQPRP